MNRVYFAALLLISIIALPFFRPESSIDQRILIKGTHFVFEDGTPFVFLGGSLAFYRFDVQSGEVYSKNEIDEIVGNLATDTGAKMMRVGLAGGNFEPTLGNYDERAFQQLDYVIAAARNKGIHVIIALRDYAWTPWPPDEKDPYWFLGGGTQSNPNKDAIILDSQAKEAYKHFIQYVLERTNSVEGVRYKDDPTIFAWDMLNDPNYAPKNDPELLRSWVMEIGKFIRSIDSAHFLTIDFTGSQQWWDPGERDWQVLEDNPVIDFFAMHYYAPASLYDPIDSNNVALLKLRISTALGLGKPVIIDEFGAEGKNSLNSRINLYKTIIETTFAAGGSGALFWSWGPLGPNGWGGPNGWDIYIDQWKELTQLVQHEAIVWTNFKPISAASATSVTSVASSISAESSSYFSTSNITRPTVGYEMNIIYPVLAVIVALVGVSIVIMRLRRKHQ